jgi:NADH:ubiquinone oxidoreductase subunit F (NADH-binding)/NADH:ubiquinone oxidoreductase subunit E
MGESMLGPVEARRGFMLVQLLRTKQHDRGGYLTDDDLADVARQAKVPLYRVEEIVSFFAHFRRQTPPYMRVEVCRDMSCANRDSEGLRKKIEDLAKASGKQIIVEGVSCLGRCDRAPALVVSRHGDAPTGENVYVGFNKQDPARLASIVQKLIAGENPHPDHDMEYIDAAPGWQSWKINVYGRRPELEPYAAIRKFVAECEVEAPPPLRSPDPMATEQAATKREFRVPSVVADRWLADLKNAYLLGMGGAGQPAADKWRDVYLRKEPIKYIVANADESEPGTFKDREIMLRTPELLVEGVIMAGLITGATQGYIYIRHEYEEAIHRVNECIKQAVREGACGPSILGTDRAFPVEVFVSPGGYICGEQSALIEAMEDRRAQPRNRPPELSANGLRNQPTLVNNVETLSWAPSIFIEGGDWYKKQGGASPPTGKGWRIFSISGDLNKPGAYEVPVGCSLGDLIDAAGGVLGGKKLLAVATSGPSGGFLPAQLPLRRERLAETLKKVVDGAAKRDPSLADQIQRFADKHLLNSDAKSVPLTALTLDLNFFRNVRALIGLPRDIALGAGIVVYAEGSDILAQAVSATEFFRNESCGKCVPCRIGSEKFATVSLGYLKRASGTAVGAKADSMPDSDLFMLHEALEQTSICGLGQVAGKPLTSWIDYFRPRPGSTDGAKS